MNVSCQSVINVEYPVQGIMDLKSAGIKRIFLPVKAKFAAAEYNFQDAEKIGKDSIDTIIKRYGPILENYKDNNIDISFIRMPRIPETFDAIEIVPELVTAVSQCLALCRICQCDKLVIELPIQFIENEEQYLQVKDYLKKCALKAKKYHVMLLLRNNLRNIGGHLTRGFCSEASGAVNCIDDLNKMLEYEAFGFCADIGICNICGNNMQSFISAIGERLKVVILKDNDGINDNAMLPFTYSHEGNTLKHWLGVIRGLRDICFDGELAIDFSGTSGSFSPLLKKYLYPLAKEVGLYFKWQIEMENNLKRYHKFVLFGAGNMCRNYMKNYGDQYPPLFTCDNNPKLWGTTFEGLVVKNPVELIDLPKDYCVVICNSFYREIELQLKEMGIENIGYFNDEYMPSFYF